MKKIKLLLLPLLAVGSLSLGGCDLFGKKNSDDTSGGETEEPKKTYKINPEFASGTEEEKEAILKAINTKGPVVNRSGVKLTPANVMTFNEDDGDFIKVTKTQVVGSYTVKLEWSVDETQTSFLAKKQADEQHEIITLNYPGYGNPDTDFKWKLSKATCGSAQTTGNIADYKVNLVGFTHPHEVMTIAQINKVTDGEYSANGRTWPSRFDLVNYDDPDSPYFIPNADDPNPTYRYLKVKGKVIYYAPDGNWALLAAGDQVLELYAGSGTALIPQNFPALRDEYVEVAGNLSQYKGNIQLGFISWIRSVPQSEVGAVDVTPREITPSFVSSTLKLPAPYTCERQAIDGFSNDLATVTGTLVPGSIYKTPSGGDPEAATAATISAGGRFTFKLNIGDDQELVVAYDYHTDRENSVGLFQALKTKLSAGGSMTIEGTMRYNGNDSKPFILDSTNAGVWNIVPYLPSQVK